MQKPVLYVSYFVQFRVLRLHFAPFCLSIWLPVRSFFSPNQLLFAPKIPRINGYFALFSHIFNDSKRFYLYHCSVSLCFLSCIQRHFALRLASKRTPFSTKMHSIQHQNAVHLAPKRTPFSTKTHSVQPQIAPKQQQMADLLHKYTFCRMHMPTLFCIKTNFRENRLFAVKGAVGG